MLASWIDTTVGCVVLGLALAANALLVFWSRGRIEKIDRHGGGNAREIRDHLRDD